MRAVTAGAAGALEDNSPPARKFARRAESYLGGMSDPGLSHRPIVRFRTTGHTTLTDTLTVEEPLDVRIGGRSVAITMRTPGRDLDLARGFLFTEGIIGARTQVQGKVVKANVVDVSLPPGAVVDWGKLSRHSYTSSSCGVCGKTSLDQVFNAVPFPEQPASVTVAPAVVRALPDRLRAAQRLFATTGGIHAAGLFTPAGELFHLAEDVGRHNALDKVIGFCHAADRLPLADYVLQLSGRASFELVQKAAMAGVAVVVAVGAPSTLAVDLAEELGVTLCGFVSARGFNVYTHARRIGPV